MVDWLIASIDVALLLLLVAGAVIALAYRPPREGGRSSDFDSAHHSARRSKPR